MLKESDFRNSFLIHADFDLSQLKLPKEGQLTFESQSENEIILEGSPSEKNYHLRARFSSSLKGYHDDKEIFSINILIDVWFEISGDISPDQKYIKDSKKIISYVGRSESRDIMQKLIQMTPLPSIQIPSN